MYYWRFRRNLLTPGCDRKVDEHQRLCMKVQGLFSFSHSSFLLFQHAQEYQQRFYWFVFVYSGLNGVVNSSYLFYINPQVYIGWLHLVAGQQCVYYRNDSSGFTGYGFRYSEAVREKARTRQAKYFQASINAQVRCQHRYVTGYRRRVF